MGLEFKTNEYSNLAYTLMRLLLIEPHLSVARYKLRRLESFYARHIGRSAIAFAIGPATAGLGFQTWTSPYASSPVVSLYFIMMKIIQL
jgi:hypothetical protein